MKSFFLFLLSAGLLFSCKTTGTAGEKVYYEDCTVYAASTDFFFKTESGESVEVRVSYDEGAAVVKVPGNMTVVDTEGPPVMNPKMKGKPFTLIRNSEGELTEIKKGW